MRFSIFSLGFIATILFTSSSHALTGSTFGLSNVISEAHSGNSITSRHIAISGDATKARRSFLARRALGHAIHKRNSSSPDVKQSDNTQPKKDNENEEKEDNNEEKEDENEEKEDENEEKEEKEDENEQKEDENEQKEDENEDDEDEDEEDEDEEDENENEIKGNKDQGKKNDDSHKSSIARRRIL
ncbi:hypothetical protein BD770DRAFT_414020 [Pilaira anomala]|nr:hypothetical protein BD770DRAFT_414020 [Pilaira anomala]